MPRKTRPTTVIIMDSRESAETKLAVSAGLEEPPEVVALREGDFLLVDPDGCVLGIERKTVSDFLGSLGDGRLVAQLTRMRTSYAHQGLIIEGRYTLDGEGYISTSIGTRWTHAALQMTLWSLQRHFPDLVVWWTISLGATIDVVRAMANRGTSKGCFSKTALLASLPDTVEGADAYRTGPPVAARRARARRVPAPAHSR